MVQQALLLFTFFVFLAPSWAQDERFYRQIISGELPRQGEIKTELPIHQFNVLGTNYRIDLNSDGFEETIEPQKRDGVDWIEIRNSIGNKVFESKLFATGGESTLYKIKMVHLSSTVRTLILFMDEGSTRGKRFESTARIFLVSYENNDLSTMKISDGPHFFQEKEKQREQYFRRDYSVNVYDVNKDGIRDIAVEFNHIQRIMQYKGNGEWTRL